jgi:ubiquinone/menaquinone biosynthesis C-methylase UbiE
LVEEYEAQDRVIWQQPQKVIEMLGDLEGKTVADIGAGTGYFAFRMAQEAERVIAVDVDPRFIKYMDSIALKFPKGTLKGFETRLADFDDAKLQPEEVDAVTLVNTYCYIEDRVEYFTQLQGGMKSGAKLLIVDYKKKNLPDGQGPPKEMLLSIDQVKEELILAGYRPLEIDETTLEYQYIVMVMKP